MRDPSAAARAALADLLLARGLIVAADAELAGRIGDPADPVTFDEVGLDSLALLTLAIDLDASFGIPVSVEDLADCGDLCRVADLIAARG